MKILKKIIGFKDRLTRFNNEEPLNKLAFAIILLLDLFILSVVFGGLSDHTSQLTSSEEYFPYECRSIFIEKQWSQANKIDELQYLVLSDYNNYSYIYDSAFDKSKIDKMHPLCKGFYKNIKSISENGELKGLFIRRQELTEKKDQWTQQFNKEKDVYNTSLLENIADKNKDNLNNILSSIKKRSGEIEKISFELSQIDKHLNNNPLINDLWKLIRPGDISFREKIINDLNKYERIYLFKELIWQLIFILPLFIAFYIWHTKSIKKTNAIQTLISSHLLVIVSIPIVLKIFEVVSELIPHHFFKELFKILELLHIIALWHYIVIFFSIGITIFIVFLIQKKYFNKILIYRKRLTKKACYFCGKPLPGKIINCPFCGSKQFKKCVECNSDTYVGGEYCINCGKKQNGKNY